MTPPGVDFLKKISIFSLFFTKKIISPPGKKKILQPTKRKISQFFDSDRFQEPNIQSWRVIRDTVSKKAVFKRSVPAYT